MIRLLAYITGLFCFVVVLGEALGAGLLWMQGRLTPATLDEIRLVLSQQPGQQQVAQTQLEQELPSLEEVMAERAMRILNLESRQRELEQLRTLLNEARDSVVKEQEAFAQKKKAFEQQLAALQSQLEAEATQLAREVIAASDPKDAVRQLMALDLEQDVVLLRGLPEKKIAEILREFTNGDADQVDRGLKIFEALSKGDPMRTLVDQTAANQAPAQSSTLQPASGS